MVNKFMKEIARWRNDYQRQRMVAYVEGSTCSVCDFFSDKIGVRILFIELTNLDTGLPIAINKNKIITFWKSRIGCGIDTELHNHDSSIYVLESYEEVLKLLNS